MFKKAYREKWSLVTIDEKGFCVNSEICSTVVKLLDWWTGERDQQAPCQLHGISKGGVQCTLPCDFPLKTGSWFCLINMGIGLLMCSGKLRCVVNYGDFCSLERNFWG